MTPSTDNWEEYHSSQYESISLDFRKGNYCLIATTLDRLRSNTRFGWRLVPLANYAPESALVVVKTYLDGTVMPPELWVASQYSGYRAAFQKFLVAHAGLPDVPIPSVWQVDHLMSRFRFGPDAPRYHVRLALIRSTVNAAFGAGFEKKFYARERHREAFGGFHMDWITFLKALGRKLPSSMDAPRKWAEWAWETAGELESSGIEDRVVAYDGISTILNLGYVGKYSPLPLPEHLHRLAETYPSFECFPDFPSPIRDC